MAEEQPAAAVEQTPAADPSQEMDLETQHSNTESAANGTKRERDEPETLTEAKKPKVDEDNEKSVEEQRLEKREEAETGPVTVGYKKFETSVEMYDYFFKFLHYWPPNLNINKYEHAMLLDLLKKGHLEAAKKIGAGIKTFQVRYHPQYKSRCFFLVREDGSADDFSFRKCVDHILPLPENMTVKYDVNKAMGGGRGGGKGGGRGNWRGRGRGGKPRN
ncbi:protein EMBRYO DEFECTIVE 514-like [Bidens hawaiensis]|uniref:protein EMBRYO DEFECTIVE 514-like n=1 Tax=Bidens hawaiensis TaxID=980011 RepID=UPI00404B6361